MTTTERFTAVWNDGTETVFHTSRQNLHEFVSEVWPLNTLAPDEWIEYIIDGDDEVVDY